LCLHNIGSIYFNRGEYEDAHTYFRQALELREKTKIPQDLALTLHNLAETNTYLGQYDEALNQNLRALQLWRTAGDTRGAAIESYSMGKLFEYQGRYGAALNSKQEALNTFRQLHDRSFWMAEIVGGHGDTLAQLGRGEEAQKELEDAISIARELKNRGLMAHILYVEGDTFFYRGDFKSAKDRYERSLQAATAAGERERVLLSKLAIARVAIQQGQPQVAIASLTTLATQANASGLKYLSVASSVYLAEALVATKNYQRAEQELDQALNTAEKLGLQTLLAEMHYLSATVLRSRGKTSDAMAQYQKALQSLEQIAKESTGAKVLERADLNPMYKECLRWASPPK
jgi:tetratricopeptide (TPR) repeat protein